VTYALETVFIAARKPKKACGVKCMTFVMLASVLMLLPLTLAFEGVSSMPWNDLEYGPMAILIALATVIANLCFFKLINSEGAVCAGQSCYWITLSGVGWGAILNGETITSGLLAALICVFCGLWFVGRHSPDGDSVNQRAAISDGPEFESG
jgi:drug/metabolite transporter (DMT)-like permease